jgi:hypothetical protein
MMTSTITVFFIRDTFNIWYVPNLASSFLLSAQEDVIQEVKYTECWPSTTSAWAGRRGFDILVNRYGGLHSLLLCASCTLESPTCQ